MNKFLLFIIVTIIIWEFFEYFFINKYFERKYKKEGKLLTFKNNNLSPFYKNEKIQKDFYTNKYFFLKNDKKNASIISGKILSFEDNNELKNLIENLIYISNKNKNNDRSEYTFLYALELGNEIAKIGHVKLFDNLIGRLGGFGISNSNNVDNDFYKKQKIALWIIPKDKILQAEQRGIERIKIKKIKRAFYTKYGYSISGSSEMFVLNKEIDFKEFVKTISEDHLIIENSFNFKNNIFQKS